MNKKLLYSSVIFLAGCCYGFIVPIIKIANSNEVYPHTFLAMQYLIASVVCGLGVILFRKRPRKPRNIWRMALLGIFTGGTSICYYTAVTRLPSAVALTMLFQYIWISILIECIVKRKAPSASSVVGGIVVLTGTLFAAGMFDGSLTGLDPVGLVFGFGSAIFWALYLFFSGSVGVGEPTILRTMMLSVGGLILNSAVNPAAYLTAFTDPQIWPYSIALSILGILGPTAMINFASPHLTTGTVSIMASSELPAGILAAWAIVQDVPTPFALFGVVLVLAGIVCKQIPEIRSALKSAPDGQG